MSILKIVHVEPASPASVTISLSNGKRFHVDLGAYVSAPGYERLNDPDFFKNVQVEEWGHGIEWQAIDMGIDVDTLNRLAREQTGTAFPVQSFNDWMQRNGLSLTTAAQALGLTRRTVIYYHCGHKPIPLYIGLACEGWEARQSQVLSKPRKRPQPTLVVQQAA